MKQVQKMNDEMYERLKAELEQIQSGESNTINPLSWEQFCFEIECHSQFSHKDFVGGSGYITFYFHNTSDGPEFMTIKVSKDKNEKIETEEYWLKEDWFNALYEKVKEMHLVLEDEQ